jgi:hypothetical protein
MSLIALQLIAQTSVSPAGFEPAIPAGDWLQTLALDRSATRNGMKESVQHDVLKKTLNIIDYFLREWSS